MAEMLWQADGDPRTAQTRNTNVVNVLPISALNEAAAKSLPVS